MSAPRASSGPLFELRGVRQERGGRITLRDLDLEIPRGEVVALVGPSGAGKTSLLRLLNRLDDPVAGEVRYAGRPIVAVPVRELRRRVGFVFQTPVTFPGTVAQNLALAARPPGPPNRASPDGASPTPADVLPPVGLDESYAPREAARLSGGEQQRVAIARALTTRPEVLLLDEPTSALDPEVADTLMATVRRLADEAGLGVVMVTHRLAEAHAASSYTIMLEGGRVVEAGATAVLFTAPAEPRTRAYLLGRD